MKQAQQLLMSGNMKVIEVMQIVGFGDRKYFAAAFRKKFGVNIYRRGTAMNIGVNLSEK